MRTSSLSPRLKFMINFLLGLLGLLTLIGSFMLIFWNEAHGLHNAAILKPTLSQSQIFVVLLRVLSLVTMVAGVILVFRLIDGIPLLSRFFNYGRGNISFVCGLLLWTLATSIVWIQIKPLWVVGLVIIVMGTLYLIFAARKSTHKQPTRTTRKS